MHPGSSRLRQFPQHHWGQTWSTGSQSGLPVKDRHGHTRSSSTKGHKENKVIRTSLWKGRDLGLFSLGKRRLQWGLLSGCRNTWREGDKEDRAKLFSVLSGYGTKLKHRRFFPDIRKCFFHFEVDWTLVQVIQRDYGVSHPWRYLKGTWTQFLTSPLCGPAWAGAGWIRCHSEAFLTPAILWFSDKPWQCTSFIDPASILRFPVSLKALGNSLSF